MKLKNILPIAVSSIALLAAPYSYAEEVKKADEHAEHDDHKGHNHEKKVAGPNGGRILTEVEPHLEFFITKDRKVKITAVDDQGKVSALGEQSVSIIGGDRKNPIRMKFVKDGESLVSDVAFPAGNDFPVVVSIKLSPEAKTVRSKFNLNLRDCPTCDYLEYACTCNHECEDHDHE